MLYNPVYEFENMKRVLDSFFDVADDYGYFKDSYGNLYENDKGYMIEILAPGVKNENIGVNYSNDVLTVTLKREPETRDEKVKEVRRERMPIDIKRTYRVSDNADVEKIEAKLDNGILLVYIPKKEEVLPKKIEVKVQ